MSYLDKLLNEIEPSYIPFELIAAASVRTHDGNRQLLTPDEYLDFLDKNADEVMEVRILVNLDRAKEIIQETTDEILKNIDE